jgi:ribosomal-protein-alanine N-acetyltransferase
MAEHGGIELVADQDGRVVGYLLCVIESAQAYVHSRYGRHAYIAELVVAEAMRGKGLGQRLIAAAETFARDNNVPSIFIGVLAGNEPADRLYEHLGYGRYSIERMKRLDQ